MTVNEFPRPLPLSRLRSGPVEIVVTAEPAECAAMAARLGIVAVERVCCRFRLSVEGAAVRADCRIEAGVVQACVVSLEPVPQVIDEAFVINFVPVAEIDEEPDPEAIDEVPHDGHVLELGEAAAEQLALSLDPYPRHPDASMPPAANDPAEAAEEAKRRGGLAALANFRTLS